MLWNGSNSFLFETNKNSHKQVEFIAVRITAESGRPHYSSLCRLYLRAYDIAHHAQFVQTVTGRRRALLRKWKYFTVIHVSKCYVFLYERQWEVCLYQFGSFHRRRRYRTK